MEDFNDCRPEFVVPDPEVSVLEDAALHTVVYIFTVHDCDSGLNGVDGTRFNILTGIMKEALNNESQGHNIEGIEGNKGREGEV